MADRDVWRKNIPEDFDGRFGEKFDGEVVMGPVVQVTIGVVASCVAGFVIIWLMMIWNDRKLEAAVPEALPIDQANENRLPTGPLLQAEPEEELEAMRHEMATRLNGFGWVDPTAGVVHIPIAQAISLLATEPEPETAEEAMDSEQTSEPTADTEPAGGSATEDAADEDHGAGADA